MKATLVPTINDLKLFQDMIVYLDVDQKVAKIVLQKLENHYWYLTEKIFHLLL